MPRILQHKVVYSQQQNVNNRSLFQYSSLFKHCYIYRLTSTRSQSVFTARSSYASAVLGIVISSRPKIARNRSAFRKFEAPSNSGVSAMPPLAGPTPNTPSVAESYVNAASHAADAVTEQAADRKCPKYAELSVSYEFQPVVVETHGPSSVDICSLWLSLAAKYLNEPANHWRPSFYSNGSVSCFNGSTLFSFMNRL